MYLYQSKLLPNGQSSKNDEQITPTEIIVAYLKVTELGLANYLLGGQWNCMGLNLTILAYLDYKLFRHH